MKLAIVGVTGLVGGTILKVMEERSFAVEDLIPVASESSVGKSIMFSGKEYKVVSIEDAISQKPDIAIFSAGKTVSLEYAPRFAELGTFVVDNSSAWRMFDDKKLIVPEVNIDKLTVNDKIVANPNCSTIQLVAVLWPLHKSFGLKRVIVSTYQSVSGSGYNGVNQLMSERSGLHVQNPAYPHQIDLNCIPHGGAFLENDYTEEEMKLSFESAKIMGLKNLALAGTVVRVPVVGGHSESVNVEFENNPDIDLVKSILNRAPGLVVIDNPRQANYPMPIDCRNKDAIFVGRIRKDLSCENAINLWIVADNLRKGAATNAVQIAEFIKSKFI
jgi:aspartate-semialdehyde dehydrogenase